LQLYSQGQWEAVLSEFVGIGNRYIGRVHFVMSPLMEGGSYNGLLPPKLWPEIAKRTA
jgi:hypothetical protein